jgi:7-cyano-7-deazaguanine synthase
MSELLLLSGGIDSIALAAWRTPAICLTVDYGQQSASGEIGASEQVCKSLGLRHEVLRAAIPTLGSGRMAGDLNSPYSPHVEFWPFRNQYLITLASMLAISRGCNSVLIGTVSTDHRHRDGSPTFLNLMRETILHQEGEIELLAPAADLTSEQLVRASGVDHSVLGWAHSCHSSSLACGSCPGCNKHSQVMNALGWSR